MFQDQGPIRLCRAPVGERLWAMGLPSYYQRNPSYHWPTHTGTLFETPRQTQAGLGQVP
jgi:hypothetical protein